MKTPLRDWIVVDIDNTIVSQAKRKQKIVLKLFDKNIDTAEFIKDYSMNSIIYNYLSEYSSAKVREDIARLLFSDEYQSPDDYLEIDDAKLFLNLLNGKFNILYLTSRTENLRYATLDMLNYFGFPVNPDSTELKLMPELDQSMSLSDFELLSFEFKKEAIRVFSQDHYIVAGIGDTLSDVEAYLANNISAVLFESHESEQMVFELLKEKNNKPVDPFSIIGLSQWSDIYEYLIYLHGDESSISKICSSQINDYSSWLQDLDSKSQLILVVATFCATITFQTIISSSFNSIFFTVLTLACLLSSLAAVWYAIQSFASRVTHGNEDALILLFPRLFGKLKKRSGNSSPSFQMPLREKTELYNSKFSKNGCAKYVLKRYGTYSNPEILSKSLYSLRAANYEKMYPEFKARIMLYITVILMATLGISFVFSMILTKTGILLKY